ncbi:YfcC family protein [Dyadobacter luticola]|uniref:YfcC family protein n=1 Tax=Dyadobacter luticola TaxID=1979387 RepID=A0A5R9L2W2_9BACT|nr:YfcC family protein [Dyadobacter luticola]TLV02924.1 YfcC family protein [Dyadobacter luticola]
MPSTRLPSPLTILMIVVILAAISTWLLPAGQYSKLAAEGTDAFVLTSPTGSVKLPFAQKTLDSLSIDIAIGKFSSGDIRKPVSVPGSYQKLKSNPQGFTSILQAPIRGIIDSIDIVLFILTIGGFMYVFNETGAIARGIENLSHTMRGREPLLMVLLIFIFAFLRASYGMEEEAIVFIPILVPLFLAAGYDLLIPVAVVFGGTSVGGIAAFSNPFSVIVASNAGGINWMDGLYERLILFMIATSFMAWFVVRYAAKIRKNPAASLVLQIEGVVAPALENVVSDQKEPVLLDLKTKILLLIYFATFIGMISGIVWLGWWTIEMSALFLGVSILVAVITRMNERVFVSNFIKGAESLLSVAFIVGVARGITIVLNDGLITDSILFYASDIVQHLPPAVFILFLMVFYLIFSLFISSSSGMAVLTMPVVGALAVIIHIPGREIVNSYLYGINIMFFISPTSLVLPSLAMVNVSYKVWLRFITPVMAVLLLLCAVFLVVGLYL